MYIELRRSVHLAEAALAEHLLHLEAKAILPV